jgi:hypothetical protein
MAEVRNDCVKARTSMRPSWMRVWEQGCGVLAGPRAMVPSANRKVLRATGRFSRVLAGVKLNPVILPPTYRGAVAGTPHP